MFKDPLAPVAHEHEGPFMKHVEEGCPYRSDDVLQPEKGGVSTGTTIIAMCFDGGVIMGADSRTSMGDYIANRVSRKVTEVTDRIYVCRSGSAADTQAITGMVQHHLSLHAMDLPDPKFVPVKTAATLFKRMCYDYKDQLMAGVIIGGWDKEKGGQVFCVPLGGALLELPYAAGGSGSGYIAGLMDNDWRPNMKKDEARAMLKKWIAHAMARDGSSGGVIRTTVITEDGIDEDFTAGDKLPFGPL